MRPKTITDRETGTVVRVKVDINRDRCGCEKYAFASRKGAKAAAKASQRMTGEPHDAYHCQQGHCWHIGHPPGWRRANNQPRPTWTG